MSFVADLVYRQRIRTAPKTEYSQGFSSLPSYVCGFQVHAGMSIYRGAS